MDGRPGRTVSCDMLKGPQPIRKAPQGLAGQRDDARAPYVAGVTPAFTRDTSQEVPRDENGLPVHFTSVLVADEKYREDRHS